MQSPFNLSGKGAIVTGSSRGIGKAIAEMFAAHGANVIVSSRKADACAATASQINAAGGGRAFAIPANIGRKEDVERLVSESQAALGNIDILVCNAASNPHYGSLAGLSDEAFEKIFRNNVMSSHWLATLVAPQMIARGAGSMIFVSSMSGLRGSRVIGAYAISKAADFQLARNLAVEYGPSGLRINCIAPGLIRTDFSRALWEDEDTLRRALVDTPLGRMGEPDDIAGTALFLASDASRYLTGQTLVVDGGVTVALPGDGNP